MRAHIIENNIVINTIEVESLDFMPGLIEATDGGIGWGYIDGVYTPPDPIVQNIELYVLATDTWTIPADGITFATVTYTTDETAYFSVNSEVHMVEPIEQVSTLEITADLAGAIRVEIKDKQLVITALEV